MVTDGWDFDEVEARWQAAWDRSGCHRAEDAPSREKSFVHDSTPFPNGPLHLGHVRCYVLGDVTARYQRLLGRSVLYHSGFDSFGLPIELEAEERGLAPRELVRHAIAEQSRQLRRLGISYDWTRMADTSEPATYRWTQWLFLELLRAGLVERLDAPLNWCPRCATSLARTQVEDGRCWRCATPVEIRRLPQWTVLISRYAPRLRQTLDDLTGWSGQARRALAGMLDDQPADGASRGQGGVDWVVSRQRSWGTPIPIVHCPNCGAVPVPDDALPVLLPDALDWAGGSGALARCAEFVETRCPTCEGPASRETDTLDCCFDDVWCYFQSLVLRAERPGFTRENLARWLPVDHSQSGRDTYTWFHLYRFIGVFLCERGLIDDADFIKGFFGHDMILAGGKKMSKHLGNSVSPDEILRTSGADVLRVAMMWAAGPQRALLWKDEHLHKAQRFLVRVHRFYGRLTDLAVASATDGGGGSKKAQQLSREVRRAIGQVGRFIEGHRPNAGVETLAELFPHIEAFALPRLESRRLGADDRARLRRILGDFAVGLSPFAPHLAEELWVGLGNDSLAAQADWPGA